MKHSAKLSSLVLAAAALAHAVRVINGWDLVLGPYAVPQWISVVTVVIAGGLSYALYRCHGRCEK